MVFFPRYRLFAALLETVAALALILMLATSAYFGIVAALQPPSERGEAENQRIRDKIETNGGAIGQSEVRRAGEESAPDKLRPGLLLGIQSMVTLFVAWMLIRWRVRRFPIAVVMPTGRAVLWGLGAGLAAFVLSIVVAMTLHLFGVEVQEQDWVRELFSDQGALFTVAPLIVLAAPWAEELFFRGYVLRMVTQQTGARTGIVVSSLIFALVHMNPAGILVYAAIGFVMAWVYRRTGTLIAPVVGHALHNGIVLSLWLLGLTLDAPS